MTEARNASVECHNQAARVVKDDPRLAYRLLCSSATVDGTNAHAWHAMGNGLVDLKLLPAAIAAFRRCLALPDGQSPQSGDMSPDLRGKAMINLGHQLWKNGQIGEAFDATNAAARFLEDNAPGSEDLAMAYVNLSQVLSVMDQTDASLHFAEVAWEICKLPIVETGLAFAHLFAGDYATGLSHFDARFAYKPELNSYLNFPFPRWKGDRVQSLFLACDQGAGDTLSFARFVPAAAQRVDRLIFQVQPEICRMMTAAFQGWPNVQVIPLSVSFPVASAWCPVHGLPTALGLTTEQIIEQPQVWRMPHAAFGAPVPKGWKANEAKYHVGIAYAGSPMNEIDCWRSIPVWKFLELYRVPGIQLYSLQVGDRAQDLHAAGCAALVRDMSPYIKDATDTVAVMRELDLVITIESFVGHLAGSMGKECWVAYSRRGGDWRIGRKEGPALWYPNHRVFRQGEDMEWHPVFERIVEALRERTN